MHISFFPNISKFWDLWEVIALSQLIMPIYGFACVPLRLGVILKGRNLRG